MLRAWDYSWYQKTGRATMVSLPYNMRTEEANIPRHCPLLATGLGTAGEKQSRGRRRAALLASARTQKGGRDAGTTVTGERERVEYG